MQYEVKYLFNGIRGTYDVTFKGDNLYRQDVEYSIRQSVALYLGSNEFDILSYCKVL